MDKNPYFDVQAEYVGAAALFASPNPDSDSTYSVNVFPGHVGGAIIWALNGHQAFFIYEEDGVVTEPIQIQPHKELLKACGCKVDAGKKRLQADPGLEYLRVVSFDKDNGEEWIDFNPAPAHRARTSVNYKTFLEKYADTREGIAAKCINGNDYAKMRKIFKDEALFQPVLYQAKSDSGEGPIYNSFLRVKNLLIITMPMKVMEDADDDLVTVDAYGNFSNIASTLISSPYAEGIHQ